MGRSNFEESHNFDELAFALTEERSGRGKLGAAMEYISYQNEATARGDTLESENGGTP